MSLVREYTPYTQDKVVRDVFEEISISEIADYVVTVEAAVIGQQNVVLRAALRHDYEVKWVRSSVRRTQARNDSTIVNA